MDQFCRTDRSLLKRGHPTITSGAVCPRTVKNPLAHKYWCGVDTKNYGPSSKPASMLSFLSHIKSNNWKLLFVGDSLSFEMYSQLLCSIESENAAVDASKELFWHRSMYLVPLPAPFGPHCIGSSCESTQWVDMAIAENITHIVLNTGAWWSEERIRIRDNNEPLSKNWASVHQNKVLQVYSDHWSESGELLGQLKALKERHGVQFIWRDIAPAGACELVQKHKISGRATTREGIAMQETHSPSWSRFVRMNTIARKAVSSIGGLIISDIWRSSLPEWRHHLNDNTGDWFTDHLHYCIYRNLSIPGMWNNKLFELLKRPV
jgi:hypothetical protein